MIKIEPNNTPLPRIHATLQGSIGPRPIAFASTIDNEGNPNLSPFSFFNVFGINPTTLIFSPSRRGRDNTTKHTFENLKEVPEVVINVVNYDMVEQMSLSSTEYPQGVNEFEKAGFTPVQSEMIKPDRVKESPVQFECKVREIIETGDQGGAGNLVICEILMIHLNESILNDSGSIDPHKIDLVGRLGGDYYCRASGDAIFEVEKPLQKLGIGIDQLPDKIKHSKHLSGNELGKLGNIERLPSNKDMKCMKEYLMAEKVILDSSENDKQLFHYAKELIKNNKPEKALQVLMIHQNIKP